MNITITNAELLASLLKLEDEVNESVKLLEEMCDELGWHMSYRLIVAPVSIPDGFSW